MTHERRILFIDLDGVLHAAHGPSAAMRRFTWLPILEQLLIPFPHVGIVIHASIRDHIGLDSLKEQLGPLGLRVIDIAPQRMPKYDAILGWLAGHPEVTDYRIIDDAPGEFPQALDTLILCDPRTGISDRGIQKRLAEWLVGLDD